MVMLVSTSVLLGWAINIPILKSVAPNLVSMVPNTALCLLTLGFVLFQHGKAPPKPSRSRVGGALAVAVAVISSLTLLQYFTHSDFGIDQFLFIDDTRLLPSDYPGRMAPVTAICLVFASFSLLLDRLPHVSCFFAVVVLFFGVLATTGYLFDVSSLYQVIGYTSVAVHTAISLVVLSLGILASRPNQGLLPVVLSNTAGGDMARRLLWMMPLLTVLLGWLVLQGEQEGLYDSKFGSAISTVSTLTASLGVILFIARKLHLADKQRQQALKQLAVLNDNLEQKIAERTQELTVANEKLSEEISERKQAEDKAHRLSLTDELTGLLNRRGC